MKTFAINLHFIAGSIEGFLVTPHLGKYVVSILCMVGKMAVRKDACILFTAHSLLCRGYVCTYQFYLNGKLISPKSTGAKSDQLEM